MPPAGPGFPGMPSFLGPSYVPYTWAGSALGAKGDLLFPIVIFVFVLVGLWAVVQFLLALVVPLIGAKLGVANAVLGKKKFSRAVNEQEDGLNRITNTVMNALTTEPRCLKMVTCQAGAFLHSVAGDRAQQIAGLVKGVTPESEALKVFEMAADKGADCSQYSCFRNGPNERLQQPHQSQNPAVPAQPTVSSQGQPMSSQGQPIHQQQHARAVSGEAVPVSSNYITDADADNKAANGTITNDTVTNGTATNTTTHHEHPASNNGTKKPHKHPLFSAFV